MSLKVAVIASHGRPTTQALLAPRLPCFRLTTFDARAFPLRSELQRVDDLRRGWQRERIDVVIAENLECGAQSMEACEREGLPLVVFYGLDSPLHDNTKVLPDSCAQLFSYAAKFVPASDRHAQELLALGAPAEKVVMHVHALNPEVRPELSEVLRSVTGTQTIEPRRSELQLCWFIQTYQDAHQLDSCLRRLRRHAPIESVFVVSDGDRNPDLAAIASRHDAQLVTGECLSDVEHGDAVIQRMLDIFLQTDCDVLVKIEPQTDVRRPFERLPRRDLALICGSVRAAGPVDNRIVSIHGGCILMTRRAARALADSGLLISAPLRRQVPAWAVSAQMRARASKLKLTRYEWCLGWVAHELGIPQVDHPEVYSFPASTLLDDLASRHAAVRHPSLDIAGFRWRRYVSKPIRREAIPSAVLRLAPTYAKIVESAWRVRHRWENKSSSDDRPHHLFGPEVRDAIVADEIRHSFGRKRVPTSGREPVVLCVVRDGEGYVDAFLEHYSRLGFKHFFFVDNGSVDATRELIRAHDCTTLWETSLPFRHYQVNLKTFLVSGPGRGHWCFLADIDEFLLLPPNTSAADVLTTLGRHDWNAVTTQMIDMFSDLPFAELQSEKGWRYEQLLGRYPFYDSSEIRKLAYPWKEHAISNPSIFFHTGGIRKSQLGAPDVWLTKESLFFDDARADMVHQHHLARARLAPFSLPFLHFKFTSAFTSLVHRSVIEKNHAMDSAEYVSYEQALRASSSLCLRTASAQRLMDVRQLWDEGLAVGEIPL